MFQRPRTRGTSVLAAVVLAGVLGGLILAIDIVTPTDARSLAAQAAGATTDAKTEAKLDGDARCKAPIELAKDANASAKVDSSEGVTNTCVKGCIYKVQQADTGTKVSSMDTCKSKTGEQKTQCEKQTPCIVQNCVGASCQTMGSETAAKKLLSEKLGVPTELQLKNDPKVQEALDLAKKDVAEAQKKFNDLPPYLQDSFKSAREEQKSDINEKINLNNKTLDELQNSATYADEAAKIKKENEELIAQRDRMSQINVDNLKNNAVTVQPPASPPSSDPVRPMGQDPWPFDRVEEAKRDGSVTCTGTTCVPKSSAGEQILRENGYTCSQSARDATTCVQLPGYKTPERTFPQPCMSGAGCTTQTPPNVDPRTQTPPPPGTGGSIPSGYCMVSTEPLVYQPCGQQSSGGGGGMGGMLSSIGQGILKGLAAALNTPTQPPATTCPTDPNAYQQYQQQYQQQLQQYQYQMQQYQYQQQLQQYYGQTSALPPQMPVAPQQCRPGTNPNPTNPTNPTNPVTGQPVATISCQPTVADVGMSVAITYGCTNSTSSVGNGFSTDGALSGATSTIIANPPQGASGKNFQITCINQGAVAREECTVQIARPTIVLVANPQNVRSGDTSGVGWVTSGMQACSVSSPDMADFTSRNVNNTSVNGMATTSALTKSVNIVLRCTTVAGGTRTATTTIGVTGTSTALSLSVSASTEGNTSVPTGATTTIQWQSANAPSDAAVSLWLFDHRTGYSTALIARNLPLSGTYDWKMPTPSTQCPADSPYVCATDVVPGRTYSIEASIYKPVNAYLGGFPPANAVQPQFLKSAETDSFRMQ